MLYTDLMTRIPDHLLMIGDRMTMAHSLESRAPLIDYKVVEFAANIPVDMKLKGKHLKHILRRVAERYLPSDVVNLEKTGISLPAWHLVSNRPKRLFTQIIFAITFRRTGLV